MTRWFSWSAGSWIPGLLGPGIRRPPVAPVTHFTNVRRMGIRPGEGTKTAIVSGAGTAKITLGPDALITWYVDYVSISTTSGANDVSTCAVTLGPATNGIVPGGQSYVGGGDTISLGGRAIRPGEYITLQWSGGHATDLAIATVNGAQDVLT